MIALGTLGDGVKNCFSQSSEEARVLSHGLPLLAG